MPNRILRDLPNVNSLITEEEILNVRSCLPTVEAGNPLQPYKHALTTKLRRVRIRNKGGLKESVKMDMIKNHLGFCPICKQEMNYQKNKKIPTIDHIKPISKGGGNELTNLVVICNSCNSRKGCYA